MLARKGPSGPNITLASYPSPASAESGSATTLEWDAGPVQRLTLTSSCTIAVSGLPPGESVPAMRLELTQGSGGSKTATITGAKTIGSAGLTLSSVAGRIDVVELFWDGYNLFASVLGLNWG